MGLPVFREPVAAESKAAAKSDPTATARSAIRRHATVRHVRHSNGHGAAARSSYPSPPEPTVSLSRTEVYAHPAGAHRNVGSEDDDTMSDVPELVEINGRTEPVEAMRQRSRHLSRGWGLNQSDREWSNLVQRQAHLRSQLASSRSRRRRSVYLNDGLDNWRRQTDDESELAGQADQPIPPPAFEPPMLPTLSRRRGSPPPDTYLGRIPTPRSASFSPRPISRHGPHGAELDELPPLRRMGRRSINRDNTSRRLPPVSSTAPETNGLGDRQRSWSPDTDHDQWETLLTTITPDPSLPSASSSFVSAPTSSFNNSQSQTRSHAHELWVRRQTALPTPPPPPPAPEVPSWICDPPESDGEDVEGEREGWSEARSRLHGLHERLGSLQERLDGLHTILQDDPHGHSYALRRELDRVVEQYNEFSAQLERGQRTETQARTVLAAVRDTVDLIRSVAPSTARDDEFRREEDGEEPRGGP